MAPLWESVDPDLMVDEVLRDLMRHVESLFENGTQSTDQLQMIDRRTVDPPHQGSRQSSATTSASLPPLGLLLLAGASEPGLALATGFGTAYGLEPATLPDLQFGETDFLVTAAYENLPFIGDGELASFVPWPDEHRLTSIPAAIEVERDGLVEPHLVDHPWRESIKVSWQRVEATAALGRPSGTAAARYDATTFPNSDSLLPKRDAGGWRALLPMPDGPEGEPDHDRSAIIDPAVEIPLGSGGRTASYAIAAQDVFGVWSRWNDVTYSGSEPDPPAPRIISADLDVSYTGSTTCPASVRVELAIDWSMRTPEEMALSLGFFPMTSPNDAPPTGLGPTGSTPGGTFRTTTVIAFSGDVPVAGGGVVVASLDAAGESEIAPGPLQGDTGRRYRISLPVPALDFSSTQRWGMRVWARSQLHVIPGPGAWVPDSPAVIAVAASPVPATPIPPPPPPGVPLGSTIDAAGRSHVKVRWSLPAGPEPSSITVWELAERSLRQKTGMGSAAEGILPGVRLQQMRDAYDALPLSSRRGLFRRVTEVAGSAREADVALPKGSTDIHLFTITTMTPTGIESPWAAGAARDVLQAVIAPRVIAPAIPAVRTTLAGPGTVSIDLESKSRIPVQAFHLYRTQSPSAARRAGSMGPPFAVIPAIPPPTDAEPDPETGELKWIGTWNGAFPESWSDWFVCAVAVPVSEVPVSGIRGQLSNSNEPVIISVRPSVAPDLETLTFELWGTDNDGVVVRTATEAPVAPTPIGPHRLRVEVEGNPGIVFDSLVDIPEVDTEPPTGATPGPVVVRKPAAGRRTALSVWFARPDRTDPADVAFRLVDPIGRFDSETITVPGWSPPPEISLDILDVFAIAGRGVVAQLRSDAPVDGSPPGVMTIRATGRIGRRFFPMRRRLEASFSLEDIPLRREPFRRFAQIQVVRTTKTSPFEYAAFVALKEPITLAVSIVLEDGGRVEAARNI